MARTPGTWTAEQARANASKGGQARWYRERCRQADRAIASAQSAAHAVETPDPLPSVPFTLELADGVRAHARSILSILAEELQTRRNGKRRSIDGAQVDRLASALERLAELERKLDNRPLPGSRRPGRDDGKPPPPPPRPPVAPLLPARPSSNIDEQEEPSIQYGPPD